MGGAFEVAGSRANDTLYFTALTGVETLFRASHYLFKETFHHIYI